MDFVSFEYRLEETLIVVFLEKLPWDIHVYFREWRHETIVWYAPEHSNSLYFTLIYSSD